ncbi:MAG: RHS repeat-associated core domain-containing protein [Armatimonadetes bacterium]|nr:RHS repeat-associated core domain-containing protein [Armatimonadota bacterium]
MAASGVTTYTYDALGRIATMTHDNGTTAAHSYDAAGRTTQLVNAQSDATTICSFGYEYDAVGNPVSVAEGDGSRVTYTYDALNQLARERRSGDSAYDITYTYDAVGNRLTKVDAGAATTYTYDSANELLTEDAAGGLTTYTYDENGNTLTSDAAGSVTTMAWSYEDEMLTVQPAGGGVVTMTYDGDHLRRKRQNGSGTAKYLWDEQQVLLETNGNGVTQARYTLAPLGYGDLVSMRRNGATSFCHFDAIGSTRALTDGDEAVTDTYLYSAFGNLLASTGSTENPYRYIGELGYQQETGLSGYYLRRRYYVHWLGRFLGKDPLRQGGENAYGYVNNRPTRGTDPGGLRSSAAHCTNLAQQLQQLVYGFCKPERDCGPLNDLLYRYLSECVAGSGAPSFPPTPGIPEVNWEPFPHSGLPGFNPEWGHIPGYVLWFGRCHRSSPVLGPPPGYKKVPCAVVSARVVPKLVPGTNNAVSALECTYVCPDGTVKESKQPWDGVVDPPPGQAEKACGVIPAFVWVPIRPPEIR